MQSQRSLNYHWEKHEAGCQSERALLDPDTIGERSEQEERAVRSKPAVDIRQSGNHRVRLSPANALEMIQSGVILAVGAKRHSGHRDPRQPDERHQNDRIAGRSRYCTLPVFQRDRSTREPCNGDGDVGPGVDRHCKVPGEEEYHDHPPADPPVEEHVALVRYSRVEYSAHQRSHSAEKNGEDEPSAGKDEDLQYQATVTRHSESPTGFTPFLDVEQRTFLLRPQRRHLISQL